MYNKDTVLGVYSHNTQYIYVT